MISIGYNACIIHTLCYCVYMKTKAQRECDEQQLSDYKHIAKHWPIVLLSVVVIWLLVVAWLIIF